MKEYKQRASSAGLLFTQPRAIKDRGEGKVAATVKTMIHEWIKSQLYDRSKSIHSKYLEKGNVCEGDNLRYISTELGFGEMVLSTNEESFEDEFFTGTPDLILPNRIVDIKSSWDAYTFPLFMNHDDVTKLYVAQLQVYMHLTGKDNASLVYALGNTPENLVQKSIKYKYSDLEKLGVKLTPEQYAELEQETRAEHNYDKYPSELRIKRYNFTYDEEYIAELQNYVINARKYIETLNINIG